MQVLSGREVDVAVQALQAVARYDTMRVKTYRRKENLADRIFVSTIGSAVALRFDDVGYFNRVYCADESVFETLPEIESFYSGGPFGCELVGRPVAEFGRASRISRRGWTSASCYAWMYAEDCRLIAPTHQTTFAIRAPEPSQRQLFLTTYLRAFEAQEDRFTAALRNMRHLFDRPELDFLMAWHGEKIAGVAMMMRENGTALLCAGAALSDYREMGCHAALLGARIRLARESGCRQIYSWAALGGQSQSNMEKAGLSVVGTTTTWRFSPESRV
jgi:hypothetical protein